MGLLNPISAVKETYKFLNDKRIRNLIKTRGKFVDNKFEVGQFVLLNDESQVTSECRGKLNIPYQSRLYKILAIHKKGFSAKLLDIVNGSQKEVLCSRLSNLSLEALEEYNFSSPTFYQNLQRLTDRFRNKYVGPSDRSPGLKLLRQASEGQGVTQPGASTTVHRKVPLTDEGDERAPEFTSDPATQVRLNSVPTEHVHAGYNDDVTKDVQNGIYDEGQAITENVHADDGDQNDITQENDHVTDGPLDGLEPRDFETLQDAPPAPGVPEKMKTRYGGLRHVPIFESQINRNLTNLPVSILKYSSYKTLDNFKVENMRIINKDQFNARKTALLNHSEICNKELCLICDYFKIVGKYRHDSGNFARYVQPTLTPQATMEKKKNRKKVHFPADTLFFSNSEFTCLPLDIHLFYQACIFNTSFREIRLLSRDQSF